MSSTNYQAALEKAVVYLQPLPGLVLVQGADRVDFIQRQTTNDVTLLNEGNVVTTALVNASARLLDVYQAFNWDAESLALVTLPGNGENAFNYLKGKIFFADKVEVANLSTEFAILDVEGPMAGEALAAAGLPSTELDRIAAGDINGCAVHVWGQRGLSAEAGFRILTKQDEAGSVQAALGLPLLDEATHEVLRVEAGLPANPNELNPDHTPLETNLRYAIHDAKGCYTGQEIIARQITYDKITKQLVRLEMESEAEMGAAVNAEGRNIGQVTSSVLSPRFGALALAVLKRPYFEAGTAVEVHQNGTPIQGKVSYIIIR